MDLDGLRQHEVDSQSLGLLWILLNTPTAQDHDARGGGPFLHLPRDVPSRRPRHAQVGYDQIEAVASDHLHRFTPAGRAVDFMAERLQNLASDFPVYFIVIDDQDPPAFRGDVGIDWSGGFAGNRDLAGRWKDETDRCPLSRTTLDLDLSTEAPNDPLDDAHAEPLSLGLGREEALEQAFLNFLAHPAAGVGNGEPDALVVLGGDDADQSARRHGLDGVEDQIADRLCQLTDVSGNGRDQWQQNLHLDGYS